MPSNTGLVVLKEPCKSVAMAPCYGKRHGIGKDRQRKAASAQSVYVRLHAEDVGCTRCHWIWGISFRYLVRVTHRST